MNIPSRSFDQRDAVSSRYSSAAAQREAALCCPVDYDPRFLDAIPPEVLERDYGCGDPSRYVRAGDTVLDLSLWASVSATRRPAISLLGAWVVTLPLAGILAAGVLWVLR